MSLFSFFAAGTLRSTAPPFFLVPLRQPFYFLVAPGTCFSDGQEGVQFGLFWFITFGIELSLPAWDGLQIFSCFPLPRWRPFLRRFLHGGATRRRHRNVFVLLPQWQCFFGIGSSNLSWCVCLADTVTYSAATSACEKGQRLEQALVVVRTMQLQGVAPVAMTYSVLISAWEKGEYFEWALEAFPVCDHLQCFDQRLREGPTS